MIADHFLTDDIKEYLDKESVNSRKPKTLATIERSVDSIFHRAYSAGMSFEDYVLHDPDKVLREAEAIVAEWMSVQTAAALEGGINTGTIDEDENGEYLGPRIIPVTRIMADLIKTNTQLALNELDTVNRIIYSKALDGEKRREHLIRIAWDGAIRRGDTRMLTYLIDRVDGKAGEQKRIELDHDNAYNIYQIIHSLFDKQLEVLNSGSGTKMICCSRRAGKTRLLVAACLIECLRIPNTMCIYISETLELTEQLVDTAVNELIEQCNLRDKAGRRLNWRKFDNGSVLLVRGLSNTKDPDLIRGNKAKIIVIDEFYHLKSGLLEYLHREVLQPMQMDYATDYKFLCAGTPPSIKGTYGEYAWKVWDAPHFFWTYKENPHPVDVEARDAYVESVLREKGLDWTSTFARREYLGEWIYDEDLLLYPEFHTYNPREGIPSFHIDMVLFGIDYGVGDSDSIIGIAWDSEERRGYQFLEEKFNRLDIKDRSISQLQYLESCIRDAWERALQFFPSMTPKEANKRILWDADDNQQHISDHFSMNIRLASYPDIRLNIQNAHKVDKVMMYDKIRDLLRTANLLLLEGGKTAQECEQTVLKRGPNDIVYPEVDLKVYHPDLLPAMRYALWNVIGEEAAPKADANIKNEWGL